MLRVFKWLWDKAEDHGEQKILAQLHNLREYHNLKSEIAYLRDRYEPEDDDIHSKKAMFSRPRLTPKEHGAIASELDKILRQNYEAKDGR